MLTIVLVQEAMAQTPVDAEERQLDQNLRGCWESYQSDKARTDYRSLCFLEGGVVETAEISGAVGAGLGGTSDGGSYAIDGAQVSFTTENGGDGWFLSETGVTCTAALTDNTHLGLTECGDELDDLHFERRPSAE